MKRHLLCLAVVLIVTACSGPGPAPADHYYRLPPVSADADPVPLTEEGIFVERFIADGIYRERSIIYSEDPKTIELNRYHYHHWIDTPSRLLRDYLIDYLREVFPQTQVVFIPDVPVQYSIYGHIRQFERRISRSGVSIAVALEFTVRTPASAYPVLIREYRRTEDLGDASMSASVNAFARLLVSIYEELVADIRAQHGL